MRNGLSRDMCGAGAKEDETTAERALCPIWTGQQGRCLRSMRRAARAL